MAVTGSGCRGETTSVAGRPVELAPACRPTVDLVRPARSAGVRASPGPSAAYELLTRTEEALSLIRAKGPLTWHFIVAGAGS